MWPKKLIKEIGREYPLAWTQVKKFRSGKGTDLLDWPDWCYLPMAAGYAIVSYGVGREDNITQLRLNPAVVTAAATWRVSQGVYRFDADLYNSLIAQPMDDKMPCDALYRLPEWCVYIETLPGAKFLDKAVDGFWAHLEHDANDGRPELRFIFFYSDGSMMQLPLHLGNWTIDEGIERMRQEASIHTKPLGINLDVDWFSAAMAPEVTPFVQLVLYLCAENADMPKIRHPKARVRASGQVDVPRERRTWNVGVRIGSSIRTYRNREQTEYQGGTHASTRPHMRRAHWHHFWTGPRDGERKLIVRWLPPIPVGMEQEDGPIVIHKIKGEEG